MANEIDTALKATADLIKTISVTDPPDERVWANPTQADAIDMANLPAVVVSKMNAEPGAWSSSSFGEGRHEYEILIAVYLADGPVIATSPGPAAAVAMKNASEWYKAMADLLYSDMTLGGAVEIIGDGDGKLFDYVTDNIIWDGRPYFGHLFIVPVAQSVIQGMSQ